MKEDNVKIELVLEEVIESRIFLIRGRKVIIDRDLAELYEVDTKVLNQAVKRNIRRFPDDFMISLTEEEKMELVTNCDRLSKLKHSSVNPYVFTEQGVAMLSSVLSSERAITVNIQIMRTFVKFKKMIITHKDLQLAIERIEKKQIEQEGVLIEHEQVLAEIVKQLLQPPEEKPKKQIGFHVD